jgi:hypothetical protein
MKLSTKIIVEINSCDEVDSDIVDTFNSMNDKERRGLLEEGLQEGLLEELGKPEIGNIVVKCLRCELLDLS